MLAFARAVKVLTRPLLALAQLSDGGFKPKAVDQKCMKLLQTHFICKLGQAEGKEGQK